LRLGILDFIFWLAGTGHNLSQGLPGFIAWVSELGASALSVLVGFLLGFGLMENLSAQERVRFIESKNRSNARKTRGSPDTARFAAVIGGAWVISIRSFISYCRNRPLLVILLQNFFFSLFDTATRVTVYFIASVCASLVNATFLLRFEPTRSHAHIRTRARILRGILILIIIIWSFWAFVSSLVSTAIVGDGLPVMWITYTVANVVNLICIGMIALGFIRGLYDVITNGKTPVRLVRVEEAASRFHLGAGICAIITGTWTTVYIALYATNLLIL